MKTLIAALVMVLALTPQESWAQWAVDGVPLTAVPGDKDGSVGVSDGAGGAIIAWFDRRAGDDDVYVQRINAAGVALWTGSGVAVCTAVQNQNFPGIVSDGAGGAIVSWQDARNFPAGTDIYAQRVNASGVPQWAANGVSLCNATNTQLSPRIASDGGGGAVVTWYDYRIGASDIYAQRVNFSGVPQWTANGVLLMARSGDQLKPEIVSVGVGGFIVICTDMFFNPDIDVVAQRVSPAGALQWGPQGVYVSLAGSAQEKPRIVSDGAGGAIVAWEDDRSFSEDVYVQRINASGGPQWATDGLALVTAAGNQTDIAIVADPSGGAVVVWNDHRYADEDIYAQHVSVLGAPTWTLWGVALCAASSDQVAPAIVPDGSNGFIAAWQDYRDGFDIYAQRINATGATQWTVDGVGVCRAYGWQGSPQLVADGAGGTILTWTDFRSGGFEVYAGRLDNVHGFPGHPEPIIKAVADIAHDQGGKVAVNWTASSDDIVNPRMIDFYSIWRAVDAIPVGSEALSLDGVRSLDPNTAAPVYLSSSGYYFERVGTQSAHAWPGYSFAAATRADSLLSATNNETFMVAAHSLYDDFVAFASNVVSGHSADNLAPAAPLLLTAQRVGADVQLNWNRAVAPDLRDYAVYRATSSGVTPVPIHFLESAEDTLAVDANAPASALYYIVTAYDVHSNQSAPSNEAGVGSLTGVGQSPALTELRVLPNHPNPFTATTDFEIGLPVPSDISIEVYDVAGRRVNLIEQRGAAAGWRRIAFDGRDGSGRPMASGVYFYRVKANGKTVMRKMVIAR